MLFASHITISMMGVKQSDINDGAKFGGAADAQVGYFRSVCIILKNVDGQSYMTKRERFFCSFCWTILCIYDKRPA
jgi:hypothetical protein